MTAPSWGEAGLMPVAREIRSLRIGLYCNYVFVALTAVGWLGIAHFWAPARADLGLEATKQWFSVDQRWATVIGCSIFYVAAGLLTPGSIAFGLGLARIEGRRPLWSITTAVCGAFISLIIFFNCCAWIVAAYRPETGADVIQAWYDWAWFAFLLGWIYLTVEMAATAVVELLDDRPRPLVPRWFTWLTLAGAVTLVFAAGPAFFQSGPFAYHGLLAFYLPVVIWGTYITMTTYFLLRELDREAAEDAESVAVEPTASDAEPTPVALFQGERAVRTDPRGGAPFRSGSGP